jgi:antitoxin ParD1/3/4
MSDKCHKRFRRQKTHMKRITLRLPDQQIEMLEQMVEAGEFPTISEAVRDAVRQLIEKRASRVLKESDQVTFKV